MVVSRKISISLGPSVASVLQATPHFHSGAFFLPGDLTTRGVRRDLQYSDLVLKYQALKQLGCMGAKKHSGLPGGSNYNFNKTTKKGHIARQRTKAFEGPQFEVTGTHLVILVGALFTLAWFAVILAVRSAYFIGNPASSFSANVVMIRRALGAAPTSTNLRVMDFPRPGSFNEQFA